MEGSTCLHTLVCHQKTLFAKQFSTLAAHNLPIATPINSRQPLEGLEINVVFKNVLIICLSSSVSV